MATRIRTKIDPIDRDIELIFKEELSGEARSQIFAEFAQEMIDEADAINRQALGGEVPYTVFVDGRKDAPLKSVKPDGVIVANWDLVLDAIAWINTQLQKHSPVLTGHYSKSHDLFADGVEVPNPNDPPLAQEYLFVNSRPYARKIEGDKTRAPQSPQAPAGVYQVVAKLARDKYGNTAKIDFSYRTIVGGEVAIDKAGDRGGGGQFNMRNPAIIVRLRT